MSLRKHLIRFHAQTSTSASETAASPSASTSAADGPPASTPAAAVPASPAPAAHAQDEEKAAEKTEKAPAPKEEGKADAAPTPAAAAAVEEEEEEEIVVPTDPEGIINMEIFQQIQDMDDDEEDGDHDFSRGIVWGYFEQAENTFNQMEEAM